jgi:UDP-glucose:(heptosyl)LPS alpha-1,3-glucosyltransferase
VKIAFVVHDFSRAVGHGRYVVELAKRFSHDHDVHVFANTIDLADAAAVRVHRVPALRANALTTVLSFPVPASLRIGRGWDIVHAQGVTCAQFNVITAHICNAGWARAQRASSVARTWRQRAFERIVTRLEHAVYERSPGAEVIAISNQVKRELAEYYGRTGAVSVIHHGVDTNLFSPRTAVARAVLRKELALPPHGPLALFVGDLRKGGATALEVLSRVPEVHLTMVSRSEAAPYVAHAASLGVAARVTFRPAVRDIERYYEAADFLLFPSPYDAFGLVISEAMACGLPVVTSRQAGASEIIDHGHDGFVVNEAGDVDAFATHARHLAREPVLRAAIGRAAREAAGRNTWDDVARETMRVYERAIARR